MLIICILFLELLWACVAFFDMFMLFEDINDSGELMLSSILLLEAFYNYHMCRCRTKVALLTHARNMFDDMLVRI